MGSNSRVLHFALAGFTLVALECAPWLTPSVNAAGSCATTSCHDGVCETDDPCACTVMKCSAREGCQTVAMDGCSTTVNSDGTSQNGPNDTSLACGQPVNLSSGAMWHKLRDFYVPGRTAATSLLFQRTYMAFPTVKTGGDFGPNWSHNWETKLLVMSSTSSATPTPNPTPTPPPQKSAIQSAAAAGPSAASGGGTPTGGGSSGSGGNAGGSGGGSLPPECTQPGSGVICSSFTGGTVPNGCKIFPPNVLECPDPNSGGGGIGGSGSGLCSNPAYTCKPYDGVSPIIPPCVLQGTFLACVNGSGGGGGSVGTDIVWIDESGGGWQFKRQPDNSLMAPPGLFSTLTEFSDHYELRKKAG